MRFVRPAALGALSAAAGILGLYVLIVLFTMPNRGGVDGGGIDATTSMVTWVSIGGVIAVLIAVHLVYARLLLRYASEGPRGGT